MKKITLFFLLLTNHIFSQSVIKTYYDPLYKTKIKEVYQVKPNTPIINGYYKLYDSYGFILVERNYLNNIQNGKSTSYFGADEASLQYEKARNESLGKISGTFNYKNGKLDGLQTYYDYSKEGKRFIKKKETYDNGTMIAFIEYYSNGVEKKVLQIGNCSEKYENGTKLAEYNSDKSGKLQGKYTSWFESGTKMKEGEFINDEKNGIWIEYNEDGSLKSKTEYNLGKKVPTQEEREIEEKKLKEAEAEAKRKESEKNEREKRWANEAENAKAKQILEKKESELYYINQDFKSENQLVITKYEYREQDNIKYLKKNLYKSYEIATTYISEFISNKENDIDKKIELAKTRLKLALKMSFLVDKNTNDLEKQLKKTENAIEIIQIFGIK